MTTERIHIDLTDREKNVIELILGHLAKSDEAEDPEATEELREMIELVRDEKGLPELDWQTIWISLDRRGSINYPKQPFDEKQAAENVKGKIEEAVEEIPDFMRQDDS